MTKKAFFGSKRKKGSFLTPKKNLVPKIVFALFHYWNPDTLQKLRKNGPVIQELLQFQNRAI